MDTPHWCIPLLESTYEIETSNLQGRNWIHSSKRKNSQKRYLNHNLILISNEKWHQKCIYTRSPKCEKGPQKLSLGWIVRSKTPARVFLLESGNASQHFHPVGWFSWWKHPPGCSFWSSLPVLRGFSKSSITLSSELRLGRVRYPREALSKTKIIVAVSKHLEVILTGIILIEDSCRYKLWCTASMVVSSSPSWKGFVLKSEPSLFLASLAIPRAVLGMWHDLPLILHGSRREGHSWRLATVVIYNDEIKELWP